VGAARELPRGIDPRFQTQLFSATGQEAEGWPTQTTSTPPTRVVPPQIVVKHPYYRVMFDCETYALDNKSVVYTRRQARTLGRRKKEVAQSFGVHDEWDGSPSANVFQFLRKFAKACDDNNISEAEAFYILQDFAKEPLESEVMMVMPTRRAGNPGEVTSYQGLSWIYPPGLYPCILSVSTSDTSRGRISKEHDEKRSRAYIYHDRQKL